VRKVRQELHHSSPSSPSSSSSSSSSRLQHPSGSRHRRAVRHQVLARASLQVALTPEPPAPVVRQTAPAAAAAVRLHRLVVGWLVGVHARA
jgi:hypothetical protein